MATRQVESDGRPDLDASGVVGCAEKGTDSQVLFGPPKEQFDLPPRLMDLGDFECRQREIVGQKDQRNAFLQSLMDQSSAHA